jgi:L-ascorbate metabolism protein UlaG (beta-lactamase superfamily)
MVEVGAYDTAWPDWHLGPEQAVRTHQLVRGKLMMPIHWGLLDMANHNWTAPIERTVTAAKKVGVELITPKPGQLVEPGVTPTKAWWPDVPYQDANVNKIQARGLPKGFESLPVP